MLIDDNSPTALIRLLARTGDDREKPRLELSHLKKLSLTLFAANLDPVYPDVTPGGYKGKLQCGVYKVSHVSSKMVQNTYSFQ